MVDQNNATRIKLLKLWEILTQETDEEHPMSSNLLMERLEEQGISVTRKTLYRDMETLNECGYEVMCRRSRNNEYYVMDRKFDMPELHIMLDAIQAASFIPKGKTKELVDKIAALGGSRSGEIIKRNIVSFNLTKNTNDAIYYSVNEIVTAIGQGKKITFLYFDYDCDHNRVYRKEGQYYVTSPCATVFSDGHYYLIAYDSGRDKIIHYRIDRMDKVRLLNEDTETPTDDRSFSIAKHKRQLFGMFSGDTVTVSFEIARELIDVVFDVFGENVKIKPAGEELVCFSAEVQVSHIFFGWCCSFGNKLRVTAPNTVVDELRQYTKELSLQYSKE